ncbi:MAG: WD40 repeat domain-containing protein [Promethearchaeota archaeon]
MYGDLSPQIKLLFPGKEGHLFSVMRVASFHSSPRFASSSFDGTVRIWEDLKQKKVLFFFSEAIEGLSITPDDSKIIVVLADSSKCFLYNLIEEQMNEIGSGLAFRNILGTNQSGTKTALVTFNDEVYIYHHASQKLSPRIFVENVSGNSLIWVDDDVLCIPKRNGNVVLINSVKRSIEQEIPVHDGLITSICRDGERIVTVSEDGTGKFLDLDFNPQFGFKIEFTPISVDYRAQAGIAVVTGERKMLLVNTNTGEILSHDHSLSGCNTVITLDSKIIKGTGEHNISIFSLTGEPISQISGHSHTAEFVSFLGKSNIIFASGDNQVHQLNYSTGQDQILAKHNETVSSVLFLRSKNFVIAGSFDDTISIWDLTNQSEVKRIKKVPLVTALAKSPSEDIFVAACSGDNTLHVFTSEGKRQTNWAAHDDFISSVFFMNDEVIISGSDDGLIKFWKRNGKLISSIETKSPVKSIGTTLEFDYNVSGHENGDLTLWEKISNRKINSYNVNAPIQRIKVVDNTLLLFAAKNRLYLMQMDGYHIINVQEVCQHTDPIRGILWQQKPDKIVTVAHSIEIFETTFVTESEIVPVVEETDSSSTIVFAPEDLEEKQTVPESISNGIESEQIRKEILTSGSKTITTTDIEHLVKISEYLTTVNQQIREVIIPELNSFGIDASALENSLNDVQEKIKDQLTEHGNEERGVQEKSENILSQEKKPDWTSIDWGKRKH